jgi:putative ABC transport system permease protein
MLELAAAFRGLRRQTGFVLVAVFTLAVGTAALAIVFTIVNAVLLRPLPYKNPNRLAVVWEKRTSEPGNWGISGADFLDWRAAASSFQSMTAQTEFFANLTGTGEPERVLAVVSSVNMLDTYGTIPLYGRAFAPDDVRSGHVALLAYGLWQRRFGGDRNAIGRSLQLNGNTYSIIGVLSPGFRMLYGQGPGDIYLPLVMTPTQRQSRDSHEYLVTARLKPGATFAQAQSELDAVNERLQREFPFTNTGHDANVMALATHVTASVRPALLMLLGAVSLLMLLACSNVAGLLLARATARAREVAIRQALGASWPQIARFLLAEAMLVSVTAAAAD